MTPDIHLRDVGLAYHDKTVFSHIDLDIPAGTKLALLGPSGVGKTSLLRLLAGLTTTGETVSGVIKTSNTIPLHKQIAYMSQQDLLLPWMTVYQNATLGMKLRFHQKQQATRKKNLANKLLTQAGLTHAKDLYPHQLSGGMRQRTALVRTLLQEQPVVLMDEPFSALDTITRHHLQNLTCDMLQDQTVIYITHDPSEALRIADQIYLMCKTPPYCKLIAEPLSPIPRDSYATDTMQLQATIFTQLNEMEKCA